MKKFGIELECFLLGADNKPMVVPGSLPQDDCGLLVEFRGKPFSNIYDAVGSVIAEQLRVRRTMSRPELAGLSLSYVPLMKIDKKVMHEARQTHTKGPIKERNLSGHISHKNPSGTITAGLHLSITDQQSFTTKVDGEYVANSYNGMWDFVRFFAHLDKTFAQQIKDAKRSPGFYEIKSDGRIEYRSLPCTIDMYQLIDVVVRAQENGIL